jgi:hypothetical protein
MVGVRKASERDLERTPKGFYSEKCQWKLNLVAFFCLLK